MYLCTQNYDLRRGGTFETAKTGTFHSVTAGTLIPLFADLAKLRVHNNNFLVNYIPVGLTIHIIQKQHSFSDNQSDTPSYSRNYQSQEADTYLFHP